MIEVMLASTYPLPIEGAGKRAYLAIECAPERAELRLSIEYLHPGNGIVVLGFRTGVPRTLLTFVIWHRHVYHPWDYRTRL